jgi:hypothetical protein
MMTVFVGAELRAQDVLLRPRTQGIFVVHGGANARFELTGHNRSSVSGDHRDADSHQQRS